MVSLGSTLVGSLPSPVRARSGVHECETRSGGMWLQRMCLDVQGRLFQSCFEEASRHDVRTYYYQTTLTIQSSQNQTNPNHLRTIIVH